VDGVSVGTPASYPFTNVQANHTIDGYFSINQYTLTVSVNPPGSGTVAQIPNQPTYAHGTWVKLTATPNGVNLFSGWTEAISSLNNPDSVYMDGNKSVTANFTVRVEYSLNLTIIGDGSVNVNPAGPLYIEGTPVSLKATPDEGWTFTGWSVDTSETTDSIVIIMNSNKNITATFTINTYTLTVNVNPVGSGTVTKNPDQATYNYNTVVQLTAMPQPGWFFLNWSGDATGSTSPLNVTMKSNKNITANFGQPYRDVGVDSIIIPGDTALACNSIVPEVEIGNYSIPYRVETCTVDVNIWRYRVKFDSVCHISVNPLDSILVYTSSVIVSIDPGPGSTIVSMETIWHPVWSDVYWISAPTYHVIHASVRMDGDENPNNNFKRQVFVVKPRARDLQVTYIGLLRNGSEPVREDTIIAGTAFNTVSVVSNSPNGVRATFRSYYKIIRLKTNSIIYSRYLDKTLNPGTYSCLFYSTAWVPQDTGWFKLISWIDMRPGLDSIPGNNSLERLVYVRYVTNGGNGGHSEAGDISKIYQLLQNIPNPIIANTNIRWQIPLESRVTVTVYDATGRNVKTLAEGKYLPGSYTSTWDCTNDKNERVASGVYFYELRANNFLARRKMLIAH
jgi:uncharacterized repeat protein (TIGR02543 family)